MEQETVSGSVHQELYQGFANLQPRYSPVAGWWWSGERVELSRLKWQLDQLSAQGVHNVLPVNLAPAGPLHGSLADDPPLFSDQWWDLWKGICSYAADRDIGVFFYDQIGFGGSNLQGRLVTAEPALSGAILERIVVDTDQSCEITVPANAEPVAACALPLDRDGGVAGPPLLVELSGEQLFWRAPNDGAYRVIVAVSRDEGFDYLSAKACQRLFDEIHGEFDRRLDEYLGKVIVGSFQDELPTLPTWSKTFADDFERRAGYRIEPVIAALWEDWGLESARVRVDYQKVRAILAEEAFFRPLHEWHEERGMIHGFDQQSPSRSGEPVGTVGQYADYLRTHRWFAAPGSDHWGTAKLHSSLAHHYQRSRTWIEAFHSTGWGGTLEETFDWLMPWLLGGASLYLPHAAYYSTHGGWWEWAPPSTCWRQPYWRHYASFADAVTRLCWLMTQGSHICEVAVLFPTTAVQAATLADGVLPEIELTQRTYFELVGHMVWYYTVPSIIREAGHDFDVVDDDTIAAAHVSQGALKTAEESYRAVVVPACRILDSATAEVLVDLCEQGGQVVFVGAAPEHASDDSGDGSIRRLRELIDDGTAKFVADPADIPGALEAIQPAINVDGHYLHRRVGDQHVLLIPAAPKGSAVTQPMLPWVEELFEVGGEPPPLLESYFADMWTKGYEFDPSRYRESTQLVIGGAPIDIEQWDPSTGESRSLSIRPADDSVEVDVDFGGGLAALVVWREGEMASSSTIPLAGTLDWEETLVDGPWSVSPVPTLDNRHGDLAWPPSEPPFPVQQWRLRHAVEEPGLRHMPTHPNFDDSAWREILVGHGTYGWRFGPASPEDLPEPLQNGHEGQLGGDGWKPVEYSLSRGIEKDAKHIASLGPKGRVPEDFWHVDDALEGQTVMLRTSLPLDSGQELTLAVAANGPTEIWWNGVRVTGRSDGYVRLEPVEAIAGWNLLEVRVTAERDGQLRGYWALTTDPSSFLRPEWLTPADGGIHGTEVRAKGTIRLDHAPASATLQVGTEGAATLYVNGHEVGRQGTFDPYGSQTRVIPYDVSVLLHQGENSVEVAFADGGAPIAVMVDGVVEDAEGRTTTLMTDRSWSITRDGTPVPSRLQRSVRYDPRWPLLYPRPHPLPRAGWLDSRDGSAPDPRGVLDIVPDADPHVARPAEWFRTVVPPGAVRVHLPLSEKAAKVWLDGVECDMADGVVELLGPERQRRVIAIRIEPSGGSRGGALWLGPLAFDMADGTAHPGDWAEIGLGSYSGGVRYRRTIEIGDGVEQAVLDLGRVRGTVDVSVNGTKVGSRIWSPYRLDLTEAIRPGENLVEVTVFNTLAPYLDDVSPTRMVFPGQRSSGLFGPIRLLTC